MRRADLLWPMALIFVMGSGALQTVRLGGKASELEACRENGRLTEQLAHALEQRVLRNIHNDIEGAESLWLSSAPDQVVLILDTSCYPCRNIVESIQRRGPEVPFWAASLVNSREELLEWLDSLGSDLPVILEPIQDTPLRHIPAGITPVFVEFAAGRATDIHIGFLKDYWIGQEEG